jgi:hypothetical protein
MLDPEKEPQRWDEPIQASNPKEALQECRLRAAYYKMELESILEPALLEVGTEQEYRCFYKEIEE